MGNIRDIRWVGWNVDHTAEHGVTIEEVEALIRNPGRFYPQHLGNEKELVIGRGNGGRFIQVIYVIDPDGTTAFPIHARPITAAEKKRLRKRTR